MWLLALRDLLLLSLLAYRKEYAISGPIRLGVSARAKKKTTNHTTLSRVIGLDDGRLRIRHTSDRGTISILPRERLVELQRECDDDEANTKQYGARAQTTAEDAHRVLLRPRALRILNSVKTRGGVNGILESHNRLIIYYKLQLRRVVSRAERSAQCHPQVWHAHAICVACLKWGLGISRETEKVVKRMGVAMKRPSWHAEIFMV